MKGICFSSRCNFIPEILGKKCLIPWPGPTKIKFPEPKVFLKMSTDPRPVPAWSGETQGFGFLPQVFTRWRQWCNSDYLHQLNFQPEWKGGGTFQHTNLFSFPKYFSALLPSLSLPLTFDLLPSKPSETFFPSSSLTLKKFEECKDSPFKVFKVKWPYTYKTQQLLDKLAFYLNLHSKNKQWLAGKRSKILSQAIANFS